MNTNYFLQILETLTCLHIIPYYKWTSQATEEIKSIDPEGKWDIKNDYILYSHFSDINDISQDGLIMQAHLDHCGGVLYKKEGYQVCDYQGLKTKGNLIFNELGIFEPGNKNKLGNFVIHDIERYSENSVTFFSKGTNEQVEKVKDEFMDNRDTGYYIVQPHFTPKIEDENIVSSSLDDLLNVALIIYLIKENNFPFPVYGLFTFNEEVGASTLIPLLKDKLMNNMHFFHLDVTAKENQCKKKFGIRKGQNKLKFHNNLMKYYSSKISKQYYHFFPYSFSEANILHQYKKDFISFYIQIENIHNKLAYGEIEAEKVRIRDLQDYEKFILQQVHFFESFLLKRNLLLKKSKKNFPKAQINFNKNPECFHSDNIIINEHDVRIIELFKNTTSYTDFLNNQYAKLIKLFQSLKIQFPKINQEYFDYIKSSISGFTFENIDKKSLLELLHIILEFLFSIGFNYNNFSSTFKKKLYIDRLLFCNFNASFISYPENRILISYDKIKKDELPHSLIHELTHFLLNDFFQTLNINPKMIHYYNEGMAILMTSQIAGIGIEKALNIGNIDQYYKEIQFLKKLFNDYLHNAYKTIFSGNYHSYFIKSTNFEDPFIIKPDAKFSRYGYFLSALELSKKILGKKNEKISLKQLFEYN